MALVGAAHRVWVPGMTVSSSGRTEALNAFFAAVSKSILETTVRRYGLLSNRVRGPLLAQCREVRGAEPPLRLAPPGESRSEACLWHLRDRPDAVSDLQAGQAGGVG